MKKMLPFFVMPCCCITNKIKSLLLLLFTTALFSQQVFATNVLDLPVTTSVQNETLAKLLLKVQKQTGVRFSYSSNAMKAERKITYQCNGIKLSQFFDEALAPYGIGYKVSEKQVLLFSLRAENDLQFVSYKTDAEKEKISKKEKENIPFVIITGTITDAKGTPLSGVSVVEKNYTGGTSTNEKGYFKIDVREANAVLVISYVGYKTIEVPVNGKAGLFITLEEDLKSLDDVVVVGYGTQKKINSTGAIATLSTKDLVQSPVANISNSLVGRLPGLFATQSGGEPGNDGSKIRIRGVGTFSGNTDPLVLVDGIEVSNYNNIDPNEIESVTILKDASSTAVYGIRGANGVLIITTKRGKTGPPKISYTFNQGFNAFTDLRRPMNSADYATSNNYALKGDAYVSGAAYVPKYTATDIELYKNGTDPVFHPNSDWSRLLFKKTSLQSQHNINISGGQKKVRYFISGGYFTQEGLFADTKFITSDYSNQSTFKRFNLRSNFNFEVTDHFKIALDLSSQTEIRTGNSSSSTERVIGNILRASSLDGPGAVDGKIVDISASNLNPYFSLLGDGTSGIKRSYRNYLNGALRFDYDLGTITKGLSTHANIAIQTYNDQQIINTKTLIRYRAYRLTDGTINYVPNTTSAQFGFTQSGTYSRRITGEFGIDYKRSFGNHNVTGLLLYNQQKTYDPSLAFLIPKAYQSYVGRATYDYKNKYLAEVNVGYNGTENFAPGNRFGLFPAYSLGWVVSKESFFPNKGAITFLKIRGSYGEVGNDNIGGARFLYRPTSYSSFTNIYYFGNIGTNYAGFSGIREGATGNPDVTWERAVKQNIGVEMRLFRDKVSFTGDLFSEKRNDILAVPQTISAIVGLSQPATNIGKMENKGYEAEVTYSDKAGKFGYRISANYSFARNKVVFIDEVPNIYSYQNRTGRRLGQFYGLVADGIFNTWDEVNDAKRPVYTFFATNKVQPGDLKFKDVNGDGIVNDFDAVPIGYSNLPEKTFGLSLGGNYKGFDISLLFQGVGNVSTYYSRFQRAALYAENPAAGAPDYLIESWTPERYAAGLPINFPRFTAANSPNDVGSTFYLADASYVRLKNTEIGYTAKAVMLRKIGVSSCRIYANANNLFTWSKIYKGIDPENTSTGDVNTEPYPLVRTINLGININF